MKKLLIFIVLLITPYCINALDVTADNYIMYNLTDDTVLLEQGAEEKIFVASLTKITTAIVAIENIDNLDEEITITSKDLEGLLAANATVAGFKVGQTVTYRDLLYGLMLPSGADAAQALAYNIAGSNDAFVRLMNEFVQNLNITTTNFTNTTGLHHDDNYSTVKDVSIILLHALNNENFKEIFTATTYLTSDKKFTFRNSYSSIINNYELNNDYINGAKTGFTDQAGYCLASIGSYNDLNYLLITAGSDYETKEPNHLIDSITIYDYVAANFDYITVHKKGDIIDYIDTKYSKKVQYNIVADSDYSLYTHADNNKNDFTYSYTGEEVIDPSFSEKKIGVVTISYNGNELDSFDVVYDGSLEYSIEGLINIYWQYILGGGIFLFILMIVLIKRKKRN